MTARGVATGLVAALTFAAVVTVFLPLKARGQSGAHGDGHTQGHDMYQQWRTPANPAVSCCNAEKPDGSGDCRPTRAYVGDDGLWRAWNGYLWLTVPADRVLPPDYAGDGRSHLCEKGTYIYCFTAGQVRG